MAKRDTDVLGQKFGKLTVIKYSGAKNKYFPKWLCQCVCGMFAVVSVYHLLSGHTAACGFCKSRHGEAKDGKWSVEYRAWHHIKDRCLNPNDKKYKDYGGRGITIYGPWRDSYEVFRDYLLATIGRRPSKEQSLDRINNELGYIPGNLRWATIYEQNRNQRGRKGYLGEQSRAA